MSELRVDAPPELVTVLQDLGDPQTAARECIVLELYRRGALSSGKAAEVLGLERMEFIRHAGRLGIPYFQLSPEELHEELESLRHGGNP